MSSITVERKIDIKLISAGVLMYMLAPLGMTLLPLLVGAVTSQLGFSDSQAGYLASIDLLGVVFSAVTAPFWIKRYSRRSMGMLCLMLIVLGNLWSFTATGFINLSAARFFAEIGSGMAFSLALVTLGEQARPDRFFSLGIGSTVALAVVVFLWLPEYIQTQGVVPIFTVHLVLAIIAFVVVRWLPAVPEGAEKLEASGGGKNNYAGLFLCFAGFACFTIVEGGVWSYMERIGDFSGFSADFIGKVLAITQVASIAAATASSTLSTRFGRLAPVIVGLALFLVSLYLIQQTDATVYLIGASLSQFAYIFTLPYLMLLSVELDPSGKYYVLITAFKMGGFAIGPAIVATMLTGSGFMVVSWMGALFLCLCVAVVAPLAWRMDRALKG